MDKEIVDLKERSLTTAYTCPRWGALDGKVINHGQRDELTGDWLNKVVPVVSNRPCSVLVREVSQVTVTLAIGLNMLPRYPEHENVFLYE